MNFTALINLLALGFLVFIIFDNHDGSYSACTKRRKKGKSCHNIYCRDKCPLYELPPLGDEKKNKPD